MISKMTFKFPEMGFMKHHSVFEIDSKKLDMNNTKLVHDNCQHKTNYTQFILKDKQMS